jgi:hypothetical protein
MSDATNPTTAKDTPTPPSHRRSEPQAAVAVIAPAEPALDDLAQRIKTEHQEIMGAKRNIVERAMKAGDLLLQAKDKAGHGNWLNWLKANCVGISERTANVYMKLAEGRATIEEKLKSAATADLTINEALRWLAEDEAAETNSTGDSSGSGSTVAKARAAATLAARPAPAQVPRPRAAAARPATHQTRSIPSPNG